MQNVLKPVKFRSRETAALSILELASASDVYSRKSVYEVWKIIKSGVSSNNFICVGDDKEVLGFTIWGTGGEDDASDFRNGQLSLDCLHRKDGEFVFLMQFYACNRSALAKLFSEIRSTHAGRVVIWDRHRGAVSKRMMRHLPHNLKGGV